MQKKHLISFGVNIGPYCDFVDAIVERAEAHRSGYVCVANVHMLIEAYDDPSFAALVEQAFLVTPDGMPLIMVLRILHGTVQDRVAGMDLFPDLLAAAEAHNFKVYFFGSTVETLEGVLARIAIDYPDLKIVGSCSPPFRLLSDNEEANIISHINLLKPHIVFIALGCPKQEWLMARWSNKLDSVMIGVGGAFPVYAGIQKRAPRWMQRRSLEWLYRLMQEPRRLWRRYTYTNLKLIVLLSREIWINRVKKSLNKTIKTNEKPTLAILGTRGIPARHGGFETFAEQLALYLTSQGWNVTVYCQKNGGDVLTEEIWNGIRLIHIPVQGSDTMGSIYFDWKSTLHVLREKSLVLTLGYNTAIFSGMYRLAGVTNLINMDGFEWKRKKWSFFQRTWLYLNERFACLVANHLIADHPVINTHLCTRVDHSKITMIPYGADVPMNADAALLTPLGLEPGGYVLVIARTEPENSILEIVRAFASRKREYKLVLVGGFDPKNYPYHAKIAAVAGDETIILGAVYDKYVVMTLRTFCRLYIHGHQVGGTNPSLLEAMAAGSPVLAHDNPFNRWVSGDAAHYFKDGNDCCHALDTLLDNGELLAMLGRTGRERCNNEFPNEMVMSKYQDLLSEWWHKS